MFRNAVATARTSGLSVRGNAARASSIRSFASEAPKPAAQQAAQTAKEAGSSSNLPLVLALGGLGGLGAWYYMGGFDGGKPQVPAAVAGAVTSGALNPKEFREFVLKEVKPYNHDSAT